MEGFNETTDRLLSVIASEASFRRPVTAAIDISNLDVNYLIPKRITSYEREVIEQMDEDDQKVAVESASLHVEAGSHPMRFLYVPSTSGEGTTAFATNHRVGPMRPRHSVGGIVVAGRSKTNTSPSKVISSRRPPQKTTACGCSTSCLRCCCTISGGSRTSC